MATWRGNLAAQRSVRTACLEKVKAARPVMPLNGTPERAVHPSEVEEGT